MVKSTLCAIENLLNFDVHVAGTIFLLMMVWRSLCRLQFDCISSEKLLIEKYFTKIDFFFVVILASIISLNIFDEKLVWKVSLHRSSIFFCYLNSHCSHRFASINIKRLFAVLKTKSSTWDCKSQFVMEREFFFCLLLQNGFVFEFYEKYFKKLGRSIQEI